MKKEEWKVVEGFEDYQVSSLGRVKSLKFNKERILKPIKSGKYNNSYLQVGLSKNNKTYFKKVHKLVAEYFLGHKPCGHKLVVHHKNDNSLDNRLENLEIVTTRENAYKTQGKYTSKYKGVHFCKRSKKFISLISLNGKRICLGRFTNELEASKHYNNALKEIDDGKEIISEIKEKTSKYKGVCLVKKCEKWVSFITINSKQIYLGLFNTEIEAHEAYKLKLKQN
jgi:hypothetical protein